MSDFFQIGGGGGLGAVAVAFFPNEGRALKAASEGLGFSMGLGLGCGGCAGC